MHEALALLVSLGALAGVWQWAAAGRERVLAVSREVCADLSLQRLDDSVALTRVRLRRLDGRWCLERVYVFEFSSQGADRRRAEVALQGRQLSWVRVDHPDGPILIDLTRPRGNVYELRKS